MTEFSLLGELSLQVAYTIFYALEFFTVLVCYLVKLFWIQSPWKSGLYCAVYSRLGRGLNMSNFSLATNVIKDS